MRTHLLRSALLGAMLGGFLFMSVPACPALATDVIDQRGHSVTFDKLPQRIVFLPIPAPSTFITIDGSADKIVGMNSYAASAMKDGIMGKLFPGLSRIRSDVAMNANDANNFTPNIESILSLQPDLIFQWASGNDNISVLDRTGIPVLGMKAGGEADFAGYVTMMGQVAGKPQRAAALLERQALVKKRLADELGGLQSSQRPRVIYFNRSAATLRVSGKGTFNDFYIGLAGGRNVAADMPPQSTVTIEQVLTWNPEVILLGNFDAGLPSDIYADPRWQTIDAVKSRRVYRMPLGGYRWDPPSQESALSWLWLAGLLHPELETTDLRATMRDWYTFLYSHALSDSEVDSILLADTNRASAGYERYIKQ